MSTIHDSRYRRVIKRLRDARHDCGLTQVQVAHALGWRRTMLSNIETCEKRVDALELYQLVKVYGLSLSDLEPLFEAQEGSADGTADQ